MTDDKPKSVCLYSNNLAYNSYKDVRSNLNLGVFERPRYGNLDCIIYSQKNHAGWIADL